MYDGGLSVLSTGGFGLRENGNGEPGGSNLADLTFVVLLNIIDVIRTIQKRQYIDSQRFKINDMRHYWGNRAITGGIAYMSGEISAEYRSMIANVFIANVLSLIFLIYVSEKVHLALTHITEYLINQYTGYKAYQYMNQYILLTATLNKSDFLPTYDKG